MQRRKFIVSIGSALAYPAVSFAQAGKTYRIGNAWIATSAAIRPYEESFLAGLREHGFERGRNLIFDVRYCDGDQARLPAAVDELLALKPNLLAGIEQVARVMHAKTQTVPIVLTQSSDPVVAGLVKTLARPGGNVTGMAALTEMMAAKQIEMLAEILPGIKSVAVMLDPGVPAAGKIEQHARAAAQAKRASVVTYIAKDRAALERVFAELERSRPDAAVFSAGSGMFFGNRHYIAESVTRLRLPTSSVAAELAELGLLFAYGPSLHEMMRRAGVYAARILKGANPSEMPVEQPTVFELVVNLKTARALGLKIPPAVLLRADRVIE